MSHGGSFLTHVLWKFGTHKLTEFDIKDTSTNQRYFDIKDIKNSPKNNEFGEFSGSPVVRTWYFHYCGPGSVPGRRTKIPRSCSVAKQAMKFY